ncbi:MAG: hypothetical protein KDI79_10760 [Anaerolineae bacterium]|nr:hypothetical protein [Anaerolineae bacterium]
MQNNWQQSEYIKAYRFAAQAHQGQTVPGTDQLSAAAPLLDERKDGLVMTYAVGCCEPGDSHFWPKMNVRLAQTGRFIASK